MGGGGIYCTSYSSVDITNSTISENRALESTGGGIYCYNYSSLTISNSILWGDSPDEISLSNSSDAVLAYCLIQGGWEGGTGIIDADPLFGSGHHLQAGSPCRDAGDPSSAFPQFPDHDIDGEARPQGNAYDIGADEFFDSDGDDIPDDWEYEWFGDLSHDENTDSDGDTLTDLEEFQYAFNPLDPDSDNDGVPDAVEIDLDGDGIVNSEDQCPGYDDFVDIDNDGTPDGCDSLIDIDRDNIGDEEEAGPNGDDFTYDGNNDGIPDWEQSNVTSFYDVKENYLTLAVNDPGIFIDVFPMNEENPPENLEFPFGILYFVVEGLSNPVVTIILPQETSVDSYYKYGATPDDPDPHWYEFMYDAESGTGAGINGQTITLHFIDGERGDGDLDGTNLTVVDPGGPVLISDDTPDGDDGGGDDGTVDDGGGGCFISDLF